LRSVIELSETRINQGANYEKENSGTYADIKHRVLLTGIRGVWRDLGNHKQYRAKNGAILNWRNANLQSEKSNDAAVR
jgi:hypothetical protein